VTRAAQPLPAPQQAALPPTGGQLHIHFHGLAAEKVAEILRRERP
jgi:hypothetical protein